MRLLLFEYLHADAVSWQSAPQGMRREGQAMLLALVRDTALIPSVATTVLLCEDAARELANVIPDSVAVRFSDRPDVWLSLHAVAAHSDFVFPVAPESGRLLLTIAERLQSLSCQTLLPSPAFIATCSDKYETWRTFGSVVPMIDCLLPEESSRGNDIVVKPRWGAGCEGIHRRSDVTALPPGQFLCQPWMDGHWLSVGVVSGPNGHIVLPIAEQSIIWIEDAPRYTGSRIPASVDASVETQAGDIVEAVLSTTDPWAGYIGFDLLLTPSGLVLLNEINPRLCSSYVGYQEVLSTNMLGAMLGQGESL